MADVVVLASIEELVSKSSEPASTEKVHELRGYLFEQLSSNLPDEDILKTEACIKFLEKPGVSLADLLLVAYIMNDGIMMKQVAPAADTEAEDQQQDDAHMEEEGNQDAPEVWYEAPDIADAHVDESCADPTQCPDVCLCIEETSIEETTGTDTPMQDNKTSEQDQPDKEEDKQEDREDNKEENETARATGLDEDAPQLERAVSASLQAADCDTKG